LTLCGHLSWWITRSIFFQIFQNGMKIEDHW
jgi:hypothetical protein